MRLTRSCGGCMRCISDRARTQDSRPRARGLRRVHRFGLTGRAEALEWPDGPRFTAAGGSSARLLQRQAAMLRAMHAAHGTVQVLPPTPDDRADDRAAARRATKRSDFV